MASWGQLDPLFQNGLEWFLVTWTGSPAAVLFPEVWIGNWESATVVATQHILHAGKCPACSFTPACSFYMASRSQTCLEMPSMYFHMLGMSGIA